MGKEVVPTTSTGCLVCGKELRYGRAEERRCEYCGAKFSSEVSCSDGHFVCDRCHSSEPRTFLASYVSATEERDPIAMIETVMAHPSFAMHGTEHHFLIPAVFLTALKNTGYPVPADSWKAVEKRCAQLPGGTCGYWGACAAGIGVGITLSILKECTPLKREFYGDIHEATGRALGAIGIMGGPRCCKRNTIISAEVLLDILREKLGVDLSARDFQCSFMRFNKECLHADCPYFPSAEGGRRAVNSAAKTTGCACT